MTIRVRLLIILLVTALTPLVVTSLTHQASIRIAKRHLSATTRKHLDVNARLALQELHQSHVSLLQKDRQLTQALLASQAREIEKALSLCTAAPSAQATGDTFGFDPNITMSLDAYHPHFQDVNDPNIAGLNIDYTRQGYAIGASADPNEVRLILNSMAPLTRVFNTLYRHQAPGGVLWMSTYLQRRAFTARYPAATPPAPDPAWGRRNRRNNTSSQAGQQADRSDPNRPRNRDRSRLPRQRTLRPVPIIPDRATNQWVIVSSQSVSSEDGSITGTTAVARTIPEVFGDMALPERWGQETEHMLIRVDPNATTHRSAPKLLHDKQAHFDRSSWRRYRSDNLTSRDTTVFEAMMTDLLDGQSGTQIMDFSGRACLWAYQPLDIAGVAALMIVPYDRVTELAATMEKALIRESLFWLEITTVVLVFATGLAIALAVSKAKSLTDPITSLIHAGRQLAAGDYEARVQVTADDELGQLGQVFNDIGPQLRERETMKESLQLAGAVQKSLLPKQTPDLECFDVAGQCLYCDETGGDYYDFIDLSDIHPQKCSVVLGDVSGHGVGAALLMASVRGIMHSEIKHSACDLVKLLDSINQQVIEDTEDDRFVTLFHGILDDRNRSFIWSSAGHEPAYWYHMAENTFEELPNTGMPIGVIPDAVFDQAGPITPQSGDLIIIGTDGIWEARDEHDAFFGKEPFFKTIQEHAQATAQQLCAAVIDEVAAFVGPGDRTDDITLIVIKAV